MPGRKLGISLRMPNFIEEKTHFHNQWVKDYPKIASMPFRVDTPRTLVIVVLDVVDVSIVPPGVSPKVVTKMKIN